MTLAAATIAGCASSSGVEPIEGPTNRVVVVGAGMAGLTAARILAARGIEVLVLEGRERIGGRTWTADLAGASVDLGAAWIHGESRNPAADLHRGFGLGYRLDDSDVFGGWDQVAEAPISAGALLVAAAQAGAIEGELDSLRSELGPGASIQDAIDAFLSSRDLDPEALRITRYYLEQALVELDYAGPASSTSLALFGEEEWFGSDDHLPDGGYRRLVDRLAEGLDVRLSTTVTTIAHDDVGVRVTTADGGSFEADRVIVTVPLGVLKAGAISFQPALPAAKQEAIDRLDMSSLEKVALRFDEVFWDGPGNGWLFVGLERGEFPYVLDLSVAAGAPTLVALHGGQRVRDVLPVKSDEELVADALAVVEHVTGITPPAPIASAVTRWQEDPFSRGSYLYPTLGARAGDPDEVAEPVNDRVLFAGEATSSAHFGTVHAAILSGIREAERLGGDPGVLPGL